jgi:hypothetical protein
MSQPFCTGGGMLSYRALSQYSRIFEFVNAALDDVVQRVDCTIDGKLCEMISLG